MGNEKKKLRVAILSKGFGSVIRYQTDLGEKVYFVPTKVEGENVKEYMITPSSSKPTHSTSLDSLLNQHNLSIADFKKIE